MGACFASFREGAHRLHLRNRRSLARSLLGMASELHARSPAAAHPTGTVTFLFTDIEGSTQRWERDRDAMNAALARHDALLRAAISAHGGDVFKTVGDAFCAAFVTAGDAIAAARDAQRELQRTDFSAIGGMLVRMALHTGAAEERDGDYFGPAVNRVARLLSIGHGGQVLVSRTSADLLQGELPEEIGLLDLGAHQLKDLARQEQVHQLTAPGLPATFPALRSLGNLPNNLPRQLTSFVGRDQEVAEIRELVQGHRLVTLVGTGGAGKTRCAIQVGAEMLEGFSDGVWLAELASIADASRAGRSGIARTAAARDARHAPRAPPTAAHNRQLRALDRRGAQRDFRDLAGCRRRSRSRNESRKLEHHRRAGVSPAVARCAANSSAEHAFLRCGRALH